MIRVGRAGEAPPFPEAARAALGNAQLRHNVRHATDVIRGKRSLVVGETTDWEALREAGRQIKEHVLRHLDTYLVQFEAACTRAGGQVHWARDADDANAIVIEIMRRHAATEVIKVKTMTSDETRLNEALAAAGEAQGLAPEIALRLARATVGGAGALAESSEKSPAQLRVDVTSPAGTTAAALEVLMQADTGLPPLLARAVAAAADRSRALRGG